MVGGYCDCGIQYRQLFNDVFSCPRCQTIVVRKDHVTMTWRGSKALILLDEFEKYVTKRLLEERESADTDMGSTPKPKECASQEAPTEVLSVEDLKDLRPCDCCGTHMKVGCGEICPNCRWVAPCSIE